MADRLPRRVARSPAMWASKPWCRTPLTISSSARISSPFDHLAGNLGMHAKPHQSVVFACLPEFTKSQGSNFLRREAAVCEWASEIDLSKFRLAQCIGSEFENRILAMTSRRRVDDLRSLAYDTARSAEYCHGNLPPGGNPTRRKHYG